jgi:hypothetical protein
MTLGLKSNLSRLLLRLHREEATGVIFVRQGRQELAVYIKGGDVVFADDAQKESLLLKEIASREKLNPEELEHLNRLMSEEPHLFGKALIERNLVTKSAWRRILKDKAKAVMAAAFEMENPDVLFNQSELGILPINFIHLPVVPLIVETARGFKNMKQIQDDMAERNPLFRPSADAPVSIADLAFAPSEQRLLSLINGVKSWRKLLEETGMPCDHLVRGLHVLFSLGIVEEANRGDELKEDKTEYTDIVLLYLSLLHTMKTGFREKQFHDMVKKSVAESAGPLKTLFRDLLLVGDDKETIVREVLSRFSTLGSRTNRRLLLLTAFNKLLYLMLIRIKKAAGKGRTGIVLDQMMKTLMQAEESKRHPDLMLYLLGNLDDYAKQMG